MKNFEVKRVCEKFCFKLEKKKPFYSDFSNEA